MDINNITKEEKALLIHAIGWAVDKLNFDKEIDWAKSSKDKLEKNIESYENMNIYIKDLKTID